MEANKQPLIAAVLVGFGGGGTLLTNVLFGLPLDFELMEPLAVTSAAISFIALLVFLVRRAVLNSESADDQE